MTDHKGTHGTITNISSGQKITGTHEGPYMVDSFNFRFDNTTRGNILEEADWSYEPDKLDAQKLFDQLPIGAEFYESEKWVNGFPAWIKVSKTQIVMPSDDIVELREASRFLKEWKTIIPKEIA